MTTEYRIEVGYGLEPILPDGKVGGFGREAVPLLRQNDYSGAVLLITQRVAAVIAEDQKVTLDTLSGVPPPAPESDNSPAPFGNLVELLIFAVFIFFPLIGFLLRLFFGFGGSARSRRGGGMWMGGPWYGGGSMGWWRLLGRRWWRRIWRFRRRIIWRRRRERELVRFAPEGAKVDRP